MIMNVSEMVLLSTLLAVCMTCFAVAQSANFPPVRYRPPAPSQSVRRSLYDQNVVYSAAQRLPGYPTQRWLFPPNVILTQVASDEPISTESSSSSTQVSGDEYPQQVGEVATPPPDSVAHENPIDLPPELPRIPLTDSVDDRAGFITEIPVLAGKSQRTPGMPQQPLTVYDVYHWEPIIIPEEFQPSTITTQAPVSLPISDPAPKIKSSGPSSPVWPSPPTLDLSGITFAQFAKSQKSGKVFPVQPISPSLSKGYAVDDIVRSQKGQISQKGVPLGALNLYPRARYAIPELGPVRITDPYYNGYIAALTGYNPPPPDRVRDNSNAGTVTLTNAYGDLWVLKRDGPRPYFEKIKIGLPSSPVYGTVSSSSTAKSNVFVIKKDSNLRSIVPQKPLVPFPPVRIVVPAESVSKPCTVKPVTARQVNPVSPPPPKVYTVPGKGNPYPGPLTAISPYSYITWNPRTNSYLYAVPAPTPVTAAPIVTAPKTVRSIPRLVNLNGFWRPVNFPEPIEITSAAPASTEPVRTGTELEKIVDAPKITPKSDESSTSDTSSLETTPNLQPSTTILSSSPSSASSSPSSSFYYSSSEDSSSSESTSGLELESLINDVTALKDETPISRISEATPEEPNSPETLTESNLAPKVDPGKFRSYVFRYDYQNRPDNPSSRLARIVPMAIRNPEIEPPRNTQYGDPYKFQRTLSYLFREGEIPDDQEAPPAVSESRAAAPREVPASGSIPSGSMEVLPSTSSSEESSNMVPVGAAV